MSVRVVEAVVVAVVVAVAAPVSGASYRSAMSPPEDHDGRDTSERARGRRLILAIWLKRDLKRR